MKSLPGPHTPSWLQRIQWIINPVGYMEKAAANYPEMFESRVIGDRALLVFVNDPQGMQQILTGDRQEFVAAGNENQILQPLLGESSVIMLDGDRHRRRRQLLMPPFHGDRMRTYAELIVNLTQKAIGQVQPDTVFIARSVMQEISLQVILQTVFGLYDGDRCQQLKHLLSEISDVFRSPLTSIFLFFPWLQKDLGSWTPWSKFLQQRQQIDDLLYAEIRDRRANPNSSRTDILSLLMAAQDEDGQPMTEQELRDELMTLMFAGHETTATAMAWAMYWIHSLSHVRDNVLQELDSLGDNPDPMAIARLPYLTAVCNETLRIHPVGMITFPRVVRTPVEMLGHSLKPGTVVVGCIYLAHQRHEVFDHPKEFRPERFLERKFSNYEFLPFGGGTRRCIGEALAQFEMKLVMATLLSRYEFTLAETPPIKPKRRGVTLAPAGGVKMKMVGPRVRQPLAQEARSVVTSP